jgi:hypothetical protein
VSLEVLSLHDVSAHASFALNVDVFFFDSEEHLDHLVVIVVVNEVKLAGLEVFNLRMLLENCRNLSSSEKPDSFDI